MNCYHGFVKIKQEIPAPEIADVYQATLEELAKVEVQNMDLKGLTVGITAGSRGISGIVDIMKAVIETVIKAGGKPVIIPAMGSHGGGTAPGQRGILKDLGISEETMGVPLRATGESSLIGETAQGIPVYINQEALKVDRLVLINRVKQHTDFTGEIESGLHKMITIGLGGPKGAYMAHEAAMKYGYEEAIVRIAEVGFEKLPIIFALGIRENWKGKTAELCGMLPEEISVKEREMLIRDKEKSSKIPFSDLDILMIGEIGKNVCGGGMDSKIVGRIHLLGQKEPLEPRIKRIVVLSLTPGTHGNACGIGLADFVPSRVFDAINIHDTVMNCVTSMAPEYAAIPCVLENDREVIQAALRTSCPESDEEARIVFIQNTSRLDEMVVSEALLDEVRAHTMLEIMSEPLELSFDEEDNLLRYRTGL